jgi:hypothetical protein
MIKTNKKLSDYKDFFNVIDYLSTDIPDIFYRKVIINEESILPESQQYLVSFSKIEASSMLGVYSYLRYKLPKISKNLKFIGFMTTFGCQLI